MESAFYGIYSVVFVSENSLIRYARSFSDTPTIRAWIPYTRTFREV